MRLDVEGHEMSALLSLLEDERFGASSVLPRQIIAEFHYQHGNGYAGLSWAGRYLTMGELAQLAQALYRGGYRTVHRDFNPRWPQCVSSPLCGIGATAAPSPPIGRRTGRGAGQVKFLGTIVTTKARERSFPIRARTFPSLEFAHSDGCHPGAAPGNCLCVRLLFLTGKG